jgi:hypothetical protein
MRLSRGKSMGNFVPTSLRFILALSLLAATARSEDAPVEFDEFSPGFAVDFGQIIRGEAGSSEFKYQPMNRNTVMLEQSGRFGEAWRFNVGFMGLIRAHATQHHQRLNAGFPDRAVQRLGHMIRSSTHIC